MKSGWCRVAAAFLPQRLVPRTLSDRYQKIRPNDSGPCRAISVSFRYWPRRPQRWQMSRTIGTGKAEIGGDE
jgi:hypothetical protein